MFMKFLAKLFLLVSLASACAPITANTDMLPTSVPEEYQDFAYQIVWATDDSMIALTTNTGLYVYDTKTYKQLAAFEGLAGSMAVFSNKYLAAIAHKELYVWNREDFSLLFTRDAESETNFQHVAISPDSKTLVTAEQKQTSYWSLPDGRLIAAIPSANFISDMVFSDENTLILADSYLGTVQEWDIQSQKKIRSIGFSKPITYFNLSQDGKLVVVDYGDYGFETWDVGTGTLHQEYADIIGAPGWNDLSGDYQTVVVWGYGVGEESGLSVWDLSSHKKISEFSIPMFHGDGWRCGALNSDGTVLAASNNEGYIYFYDLESGKKIGEIYLPYRFKV
jgi:WD40 repeat protein